MPLWNRLATRAALVATVSGAIAACTPPAPPPPPAPPVAAAPAPPPYVPILPLPPKPTVRNVFTRNGQLVGVPSPLAPNDPSVRVLHGTPRQARELFDTLTRGGRRIASPLGTSYRVAGGAVLTFVEHDVPTGSSTERGATEIFVNAPGVPVSQLIFFVPPQPPSMPLPCPNPASCPTGDDGGGGGDM